MTQPTPAQVWAQHFAEMREWLDPAVAEAADPAAAEARGYRKAIAALRDSDRYETWVREDMTHSEGDLGSSWPYWSHAPRFADYLEAIAEEGK